jgi:hypothetical protein
MFLLWIVCDLIQALATMANFRWAFSGSVTEGAYCRTQSVFEQIGDSGAALCVIIISILVLVRIMNPAILNRNPHKLSLVLVLITSLILLLIILVPATVLKRYYGDTDLWCWIVDRNPTTARLRFGTEYVLMWIALGTETVVYTYILLRTSTFDDISFKAAIGMFWYAVGTWLGQPFCLQKPHKFISFIFYFYSYF